MQKPDPKLIKWLYGYVIALAVVGVIIHVLGFLNLGIGDAPTSAHIIMTVLDVILLIAITVRGKISFFFIVTFLSYGVASQIYWTIEAVIKNYDKPLLQALMASLVTIAQWIVISQRGFFLKPAGFRTREKYRNDS